MYMFSSTVALPGVLTLESSVHHSPSPRGPRRAGENVHIQRRKKRKALDAVNTHETRQANAPNAIAEQRNVGQVARRQENSDRDVI
jgi:hypothetical protein